MPLKDDDPRKWEYKEHTRIKHIILEKYLKAWINILGKDRKVCYFDCFAGRGKYLDGTEGSPLIALKAASDLINSRSHIKEIELTFIEKDKSNYENLKIVLNEELKRDPSRYHGITVHPPINDEFVNVVSQLLEDSKRVPPSFFFIDPFGFSGIPFKMIQNILSIPKTEVFINFMIRDVNRFLNSNNHLHSIEELYGMDNVNDVINSRYQNLDREPVLLKLYREQLYKNAGVKFTYPFKVNDDEKLQTTYYLIHVTNHLRGCEVMKEIMYNAGTKGRFGYLGPEEGQMTLSSGLNLKDYLIDIFSEQTISFEEIRIKTVNETQFITKEYKSALIELEQEKKISITDKGKQGGINDNSLICFKQLSNKEIIEKQKEQTIVASNQNKPTQASLLDF